MATTKLSLLYLFFLCSVTCSLSYEARNPEGKTTTDIILSVSFFFVFFFSLSLSSTMAFYRVYECLTSFFFCSWGVDEYKKCVEWSTRGFEQLGRGLCGSLQLGYDYLFIWKSRCRLVSFIFFSFAINIFCFCWNWSAHLWGFFDRGAPSQSLSGTLAAAIGNLTNLRQV